MNQIIRSDTRAPVAVGDTVVVGNGWEFKIDRLPAHPGYNLVGYRNEAGAYREITLDKIGLEWTHPHRRDISEAGDYVLYKGLNFKVSFPHDTDAEAPWKDSDGCGIVSGWTTRAKRPGERILSKDGNSKRYYDWQGTISKAKHDGWRAYPYEAGSKGELAARAVQRDFDFLKAWCDDEWRYVVAQVECDDEYDALGRVETWKDYHVEQAWEMIEDMAAKILAKRAAAAKEQEELQVSAAMIWSELSDYYNDLDLADTRVHTRRGQFNRILAKAGLQPIAETE